VAAAAGVTVGSVWLDVLPSMRRFGSDLVDGVDDSTRDAGRRAGENLGDGAETGLKGRVSALAAVGATAGLAVGAALGVAVSQAMDIESGRAKLSAQLGLTADESARYGKIAGDVYSNAYGESLDQVNEAIAGVHRNIGENLNDADMSSITGTVLNLASTFDVDLGGATAAVGQMMKTGLAPDAKTALDIVTAGFQAGVDKSGDFLDTLNEYGTQFRKLGIDGQTATGLISQGLQAGARDGDLVADALKEFSIRAIDGSTASAAGFETLGLSAKDMTAQIAKGGPSASAGLQTVLDKLRGMKDPVAQSGAAVALFGTQAEDLGQALFSLNPGTAVATLGEVGGAADRMNTTLGDTAASKLESFQRTVMTTFVTVIGGYAIPIIENVAGIIGTVLGPALTIVGGILTNVVVPAFQGFFGWLRDSQGWLVPLAVGIGAFVLVLNAAAIATTLWGLATSAAATVMGIARGAVMAFQIGMWLLNAAMAANPIGIIVALLVGLVAGLIYAYQSSETFRAIVQGALNGVVVAAQAVGGAFVWLWQTVLEPVFSAIGLVVRVVAAILFTILFYPVFLAVNLLGELFTWLYNVAVRPALEGVGIAAQVAGVVLGVVFGAINAGLGVLGGFFTWLYNVAVRPAFEGVSTVAGWLWGGLQVYFGLIQSGLRAVGDFFGWVYETLIRPALEGVGAAATNVYNGILRPVFDAISSAVGAVGDSFRVAVDAIGTAWGRIQAIVRPPVEFVVNAVYNGGIRPAWNFIAGLFGLGLLPELHFAKGGLVPGYAPGKDIVPALLSPGEAVLVPEAVRMIGADNILALNHQARTRAGRRSATGGTSLANGEAGDIGYLGDYPLVKKFADGGIVGWLWDKVGSIGSFIGGIAEMIADPVGAVRKVFGAIGTGGLGGAGQLSEALLRFPGKVIDGAVDYVKKFISENVGKGGFGAALAWAKTQAGKPYQWGGGGNPSWDCSGFMGGITSVIRGKTPGRIGGTGTMPWPGFVRGDGGAFIIGNSTNTGDGIGHMAGTLLGTNVESAGGNAGVRVGGAARGAHDRLFPAVYSFQYDNGGMLPPGWSSVYNGTRRPEPVLTDDQWQQIADGTQGGDEFALTSGALEILDDGLVRVVDGRIRRVGSAISNGRRA
jgi:hypothetical protein